MKRKILFLIIIFSSGKFSDKLGFGIDFFNQDIYQLFLTLIYTYAILKYFSLKPLQNMDKKIIGILLTLVFYSFSSCFWSNDTTKTLLRTLLLLHSILAIYSIASKMHINEILSTLYNALSTLVFINLLICILIPQIGIATEFHETAWNGFYVQKNTLGRITALAIIISLSRFFLEDLKTFKAKLHIYYTLFISTIVLLKSESKTGLAVAFLILLIVYMNGKNKLLRRLLIANTHFIFAFIFLFFFAYLITNYQTLIYLEVDESLSLTGRIPIWIACIPLLIDKLFFGYGFGGFWVGSNFPSVNIWNIVKWEPNDSHNGFIDITLDLGITGIIMVLYLLYVLIKNRISVYGRLNMDLSSKKYFFYNLIAITFIIFYNFTESALIRPTNLLWVLLVILIFQKSNNIKLISK